MIRERKKHVFIHLIKNEIIKFYSTKMVFIIVILLILGVMAQALSISSEKETVFSNAMEVLDYEIRDLEETIYGDAGMSNPSYFINKLQVDYYMRENNIEPIKIHSIGNLIISLNKLFSIVVIIMILGAGKIFSDEYTYQTLPALISRPCNRIKIFFSKMVTLISLCIFVEAIILVLSVLVGGLFWGFDGIGGTIVSYNNGVVVKSVLGQALYYSFFNFFTLLACASMTVLISLLVKNGIIAICSSIIIYIIGSTMVLSLAKYEILKYSLIANIQFQIYFDGSEYFEGITEGSSIINILIHVALFTVISIVLFYKRNGDE